MFVSRQTVICETRAHLLALRRQDYVRIMSGEGAQAMQERVKLLRTCEAFGFMRTMELLMLAEVAELVQVRAYFAVVVYAYVTVLSKVHATVPRRE